MFDTYVYGGKRTEYVPYEKSVSVTEKRAPTDESVKLLNEFEEKARQNIINTVILDSNELKAIGLAYEVNPMFDYVVLHLRYKLNDKEHRIKHNVKREEFRKIMSYPRGGFDGDRYLYEFIKQFLIEHYSNAIAKDLLEQMPEIIGNVANPKPHQHL